MSDNAKITIMAIIENIVCISCFTFLAWFFNHWWIVLFSALFLNTGLRYIEGGKKKDEK